MASTIKITRRKVGSKDQAQVGKKKSLATERTDKKRNAMNKTKNLLPPPHPTPKKINVLTTQPKKKRVHKIRKSNKLHTNSRRFIIYRLGVGKGWGRDSTENNVYLRLFFQFIYECDVPLDLGKGIPVDLEVRLFLCPHQNALIEVVETHRLVRPLPSKV